MSGLKNRIAMNARNIPASLAKVSRALGAFTFVEDVSAKNLERRFH